MIVQYNAQHRVIIEGLRLKRLLKRFFNFSQKTELKITIRFLAVVNVSDVRFLLAIPFYVSAFYCPFICVADAKMKLEKQIRQFSAKEYVNTGTIASALV